MFRLLFLFIFLTGITAKASSFVGQIKIVKDFSEYKRENPGLEYTRLEKDILSRGRMRYTIGNRVNGDQLVADASDSAQWSSPQNLQLIFRYPSSGLGLFVTFAVVVVDQSSNIGEGYVIGGGITQRTITLLIEARETTYFNYNASVYARDK